MDRGATGIHILTCYNVLAMTILPIRASHSNWGQGVAPPAAKRDGRGRR